METIYILFFCAIALVIIIGLGLEISKGIDEFIIYVLFWILYIITIITFINIVLVGKYYLNMKDKKGPMGKQGVSGERGVKGDTGLCDSKCRDNICANSLNEIIINKLKEKNRGVATKINNIYIKSKINQMCSSDEFKQLAPYKGPFNLINYLKTIWELWFELLYKEGGIKYFETIGAEMEFEWLKDNPFDELKKFDVFYWGMGKQYRPQIVDKCYYSKDGVNPTPDNYQYILRTSETDYYDKIGDNTGTGASQDISFWRAKQFTYKGNVFYPVGDIIIGPTRAGDNTRSIRKIGDFTIHNNTIIGPKRRTLIVSGDVKSPIDYKLIWTNNGKKGKNFWIWNPIAPSDYRALGDIFTTSADKPPTDETAPIRCVPIELTTMLRAPRNILWSSHRINTLDTVNCLGYIPNNGNMVNASSSNAYNLFRGINNGLNISTSDENANFYMLNKDKYDFDFKIGRDKGNPDTSNYANRVGKGYIKTKQTDSKYSIMHHLKLKNNIKVTHSISKKTLTCELIPNAISNAYLIKDIDNNNKCLNFNNNVVKYSECDEFVNTQLFSIIFTGNKKNECRIQNYISKKYIKFENGILTLIDENDTNDIEHTLFIMI